LPHNASLNQNALSLFYQFGNFTLTFEPITLENWSKAQKTLILI